MTFAKKCTQLDANGSRTTVRDDSQQKAYRHIRNAIVGFQLKPNERLVTEKLAKDLSVSRTPVREALSRLEQEGLVHRAGGWGYAVRQLRLRDVEELFTVREALEVLAVSEALRHIDGQTIAELEHLLEEASQRRRNPAKFIAFNRAFYGRIAVTARNELLRTFLGSINDRIQSIGAMTVRYQADRAAEILEENRALLEALKSKDESRAVAAIRHHIRKGREYAVRIVGQHLLTAEIPEGRDEI